VLQSNITAKARAVPGARARLHVGAEPWSSGALWGDERWAWVWQHDLCKVQAASRRGARVAIVPICLG